MAVDDNVETFWASKFDDTKKPFEFAIDFGEIKQLRSASIFWEFPALAFSVSLSLDGDSFIEVFTTDTNVLRTTHMNLGSASAKKLRIVMFQASARRCVCAQISLGVPVASPNACRVRQFVHLFHCAYKHLQFGTAGIYSMVSRQLP